MSSRKRQRLETGSIWLPRDAQASACNNYLTIGLALRVSFSDDVFPDPILALVLGYCGPPMSFVVTVIDHITPSLRDRFSVVGVFDSRAAAVLGALQHMEDKQVDYRFFIATDDDQQAVCEYDEENDQHVVVAARLSEDRREKLFDNVSKYYSDTTYHIHELSIRST